MTDTVIHDRKPAWMREVDNRKPPKTIKDRPLETKITPPVKLEEVISGVWAVVKEDKRLTNEKLTKLEGSNMQTRGVESNLKRRIEILEKIVEGHQHSITLLLEHDRERLNREVAKQTERNAKKDRSTWSKVKRLLPYKDELEHKYIVD